MSKMRMVIIGFGIMILLLFSYSIWNSKEILMRCYTTSENGLDRSEVVFNAKFIEYPLGMIYIDGVLNYNDNIYKSSRKFLIRTKNVLNEQIYEVLFEDLKTNQSTQIVNLRIPRKSLHGEIGTALFDYTQIADPSGKLSSASFVCNIEELSIH